MFKNILIPMAPDHSTRYDEAIDTARKLLQPEGKITALSVLDAIPDFVRAEIPHETFSQRVSDAESALKEDLSHVDDVSPVVVSGHSYRTILEYAEKKQMDCIVITSHKPGFSDFLIGSTAARVVRHAQCSVVVLR